MRRTLASVVEPAANAGIAILPLACWPNLERAFFTPKLTLLLFIDALLALTYLLRRRHFEVVGTWRLLVWLAAVSASALLGAYAGIEGLALALSAAPLFWAVASGILALRPLALGVATGAAVESAVAVLQFLGADPLQLLGWQPEQFLSPRMRIYGTLGNPDFVAAWCCATLPLSYFAWVDRAGTRRGATFGWGMLVLQLAAILATGSRAALLALAVQAVVLLVFGGIHWRKWLVMLFVAAALALLTGSRSLTETLQGRLYLARVSLSQANHIPLTGYGPGSFELKFAEWQVEWLHGHGIGDARFAGAIDHAHNDYVEFLVEYGPVGLIALLAAALPLGVIRRARFRPLSGFALGAAAGFAGLLSWAFVDFPLHRPAEWAVFWLFSGVVAHSSKADPITQVQEGDS